MAFFRSASVDSHCAFRRVRLMGARDGGVQVCFRGRDQVLLRLHGRLRRLQVGLSLHALLIGRDARLGQFNRAAAVALGAVKRGLCLKQLRFRR